MQGWARGGWMWAGALALLTGCAAPGSLPPLPKKGSAGVPEATTRTHLGILHDGQTLRVGDLAEDAERIFVKPPDASTFKELPPGFEAPYRARGWESRSQGFGSLYYDNRLVLALYTQRGLSEAEVALVVKSYVDNYGEPKSKIGGAQVAAYFWESRPQRLMLHWVKSLEDGKVALTSAIGDWAAMDVLRMDPAAATEDVLSVENAGAPKKAG